MRLDERVVGDDVPPFFADTAEAAKVPPREADQDAGQDVSRQAHGGGGRWLFLGTLLATPMQRNSHPPPGPPSSWMADGSHDDW